MRDAVSDGPDNIQAMIASRYVAEFDRHNGYLLADIGHYGTDYELRAMTDKVGVGALKPKIAIYAFTQTAHDLTPLTGGGRYVLHIPAGDLPIPAKAFWSLTLYDSEVFLFANPFDRYLLNDRSDLHYNADGSLDLYVQAEQPADAGQAQNWHPVPAWRRSGDPRLLRDPRRALSAFSTAPAGSRPLGCPAAGAAWPRTARPAQGRLGVDLGVRRTNVRIGAPIAAFAVLALAAPAASAAPTFSAHDFPGGDRWLRGRDRRLQRRLGIPISAIANSFADTVTAHLGGGRHLWPGVTRQRRRQRPGVGGHGRLQRRLGPRHRERQLHSPTPSG